MVLVLALPDPRPNPLELQSWLEWAGGRLIAMPGGKIKPAEPGVMWPEYSQERFELLTFRGNPALRASAPSAKEIDLVDEILALPALCDTIMVRRVLQVRCLVHPVNGRHLYSWVRISKLLSSDRRTVRLWHLRGLREVAQKVAPARVCTIRSFLSPAA